MAIVFRAGNPNFPANQDKLNLRLEEIEQLINNDKKVPKVNIKFSEAAFKLMEDCALITEGNLKLLCSAQSCESIDINFKFPFNPDEGPLRLTNDNNDVLGSDGCPRFYNGKKRRIESNGQIFLFSNDWYNDYSPYKNKRAFYEWLKDEAQNACDKHWAEQNHSKASESIEESEGVDIWADSDKSIDELLNTESGNVDEFRYSYSGICIDSYTGSAEHVTIPAQINSLPVTSIGDSAFSNCRSLTEITIPDSVTEIGNKAFSRCKSLKSIIIPDSVISIGNSAFWHCTNLTEVIIPYSVTYIGYRVFEGCESLEGILIPDTVRSIGNEVFCGCVSLTEVIIPDSILFIGNFTFGDCWSLTDITIPDSVENVGYGVFYGCEHLEKIYINAATLSREMVRHSIDNIREQNPSCKILPIPKE